MNNGWEAYKDMIDLPHHVSSRHARMPIADRAAQFAPFAALTGYGAVLKETERLTETKIELDEDAKEKLDEKIRSVMKEERCHPEIAVTFFEPDEKKSGGSYVTISGHIKKLDEEKRLLILEEGERIRLNDVFDISENDA